MEIAITPPFQQPTHHQHTPHPLPYPTPPSQPKKSSQGSGIQALLQEIHLKGSHPLARVGNEHSLNINASEYLQLALALFMDAFFMDAFVFISVFICIFIFMSI